MTTEANNTGEGDAGIADEGAAAAATEGAAVETSTSTVAEQTGHEAAGSTHVRPEGIPDEFWDDATGLKVGDLAAAYRDLVAKDAERTADVPGEADAYDLALPDGLDLPQGIEIEIKADDPLWAEFQAIGKEQGVTKAGFQKFVGAFAKYQAASRQADINDYVAQKTALGANADARIKAAADWMGANLTKSEADALGGALISAEGVKALERIITLKSGPRAAEGAGATGGNRFEGLRGGDLLDAVRTNKAA
ncbi:hypothetical protein [Brevundimonas diminuta]|uniref:hypothetical protein n=1 Tax=Brevundimonas diminuta TaxID=293 RepID=UPI003D9A7E7F